MRVGLTVVQLIGVLPGPLTVQEIEPAGLNVEPPETTTVKVVVPPRVAALLVIALIVAAFCEIPTVRVLEVALV